MTSVRLQFITALWLLLLVVGCSSPKPMYSWTQDSDIVPAIVSFNNESEKADSFVWKFGDGMTSNEVSPHHRYIFSGRYIISLTGIKDGKEKTIEKEIFIGPPKTCLIEMVTSAGAMMIELYDVTTEHRDNFIKLAEEGYYEGLLFHRVIEGFMIQGGDPKSKGSGSNVSLGSGGPGYTIPAEIVDSFIHVKGAIAAARTGDAVNPERRSSGSQFYIVQGQSLSDSQLDQIENRSGKNYSPNQRNKYIQDGGTPFLDGQYTVFGQVISGLAIIDKIASSETGSSDRPLEDIKIIKVNVIK